MQRYVTALLSGLSERFAQAVAAAPGFFDAFPELRARSIELIPIDIGDRIGPGTILQAVALAGKIRSRRTDIVHSHGYKAALPAAIAARLAGAKSIITAHNLFPPNASPAAAGALRFASRLSDKVVAASPALADSVAAVGVDVRKIVTAPPGIHLSLYDSDNSNQSCHPEPVEGPEPVVLCIARLTKVKGVEHLVRASARLAARYPEARVLIAGDGPDADALRDLAREIAPDYIHFLGFREDVPSLLRSAAVVVVPSLEEGLGLVAVEAMASRKPVVASEVGGLAGLVKHNETGVLVPPADPDALAHAIISLLDSPDSRRRMGEAGRRVVESEYTIEKMIHRMEEVYQCVVL